VYFNCHIFSDQSKKRALLYHLTLQQSMNVGNRCRFTFGPTASYHLAY
jgi:hypothetical protein